MSLLEATNISMRFGGVTALRNVDVRQSANETLGITLLVIEHNMRVIMDIAERIYCLAHGRLLAAGSPDEIRNDQRVIDAYLGAR